ncbi:M24 family metallopeptidase [Pediococcus claussenii]|uniref:Xaa-Pro dipeptidase n=1 Tax=Pediococcus claussenii (strain ATCC BAA-344 / DSM 14800 / JCM 18046 / KCTC 3811 / LMG 21948 / P06) TaxID=701521 RepID=G8PCP1_PEDCP|nr:Xaa-Pro peptidase family protein [Pediococcus claussenii]AEV95026.1 xaa-Pro dipeptidase [Pediococcus claussenii ATCC BAA-344]ANZ70215.1 dipeptidase [Pediococcus claussenii]ANZ72031.1 dipeptidase [Pediococcus claussenii]KRN19172.1 pepQ protein [Pediococcus claussenii]
MSKLDEVQKWVSEQHLDLAYISDFESIHYLTGFGSDPIERVLALFVFPDHEPFLFAPALEVEAIKDTGWNHPVYGYLDHEKPFTLIAEHIKQINPNPVKWGIEKDNLTVDRFELIRGQFPDATFTSDLTPLIQQLRLIKTNDEIAKLDAAGREADYAFEVGFKAIQAGKSEADVAAELEYALKKRGVMNMSFDTLIQAGAHAAEPHGATGATKIQNNELILFDLGTVHEGYISDASRTVALGALNDKQADIYKVCLEAQLTAQAAAKPGITAASLDKIARDIITKAGYGEYFIHRLGHGMGMGEHEFPSIMEGNNMVLQEGMCFSIEPGIYIPEVAGVRIEDCVHITKDGCKPFTHTSKELQYM